MARQRPTNRAAARAGNYAADVDTVGMDESMKETLNTQPGSSNSTSGLPDVGKMIQGVIGKFRKKKKKAAAPAAPPALSDEERDRLSRKYLGK